MIQGHAKITKRGLTLLEIVAALGIVSVMLVFTVQYLHRAGVDAKQRACQATAAEIEIQAERYRNLSGSWPKSVADLNQPSFFPAQVPSCPVDGSSYTLDLRSGIVKPHVHP